MKITILIVINVIKIQKKKVHIIDEQTTRITSLQPTCQCR